jgi:hypothetical protein
VDGGGVFQEVVDHGGFRVLLFIELVDEGLDLDF